MTYELSQKLKEAGFPQPTKFYIPAIVGSCNVYRPTLSELIEACSSRINTIHKVSISGKEVWSTGFSDPNKECSIFVYGNTIDESVANYWIELNKK